LDADIGVARATPIGQAHQTDRETQGEFTAPRLVEEAAAQSIAQQMQLGLAHCAF
jgi:hypothetical protein